jgi:hypothetical protein
MTRDARLTVERETMGNKTASVRKQQQQRWTGNPIYPVSIIGPFPPRHRFGSFLASSNKAQCNNLLNVMLSGALSATFTERSRTMKIPLLSHSVGILFAASPAFAMATELPLPAPLGKPATTVYRMVTPDGQIVYSDKILHNATIDETITVDPAVGDSGWMASSGNRPAIPPQINRTQIEHVASVMEPGRQRTFTEAEVDVIRAEMLLEDAKKRYAAGTSDLSERRDGSNLAPSRMDEADETREQFLSQQVNEAEGVLKKALAERNALRNTRWNGQRSSVSAPARDADTVARSYTMSRQ